MMSEPRVVVVGAGMSGLAAAWSLIRNGVNDVIVLEALNRTGGRTYTVNFGSRKVDLGAQFIHGQGSNPVYKLAGKHNLIADYNGELDDLDLRFHFSNGLAADRELAKNLKHQVTQYLSVKESEVTSGGIPDQSYSFGGFIQEYFDQSVVDASDKAEISSAKKGLLNLYHNIVKARQVCDTWEDLSLEGVLSQGHFEGQEYGGLTNGYQSLLDVLLEDIPDSCIKLGQPVSKISWNDSGVRVYTETATYDADHVIVTTSLGYLRQNHTSLFVPPLSEAKASALQHIGFGTLGKIFLEFDKPFWEETDTIWNLCLLWTDDDEALQLEDVPKDAEPWYRSLVCFRGCPHYPSILVGMVGGHDGEVMESRSAQEVGRVCHQLLTKFLGRGEIPKPTRVVTTSWHDDPYFLGSYSYAKVPKGPEIYDELAKPLPSTKNPRLQFAGEGTERDHHSTVQGALISGEREAQRLLVFSGRTVDHALWRKPSA